MKLSNVLKGALILPLFIMSCKGPSEIVKEEPVEKRDLEEIVVKPDVVEEEKVYELPTYNPSYKRTNDLLHTKLELSFNWEKQHVLGKAWLDFKPLFYSTNILELDAKGFDIHAIEVNGKKVEYDYDDEILTIALGKEFSAKEKYQVFIDYTAKPNERKAGGSAAITSDKGLFFINPTKDEGDKPQQIWTQGETENNSAWFPTVDKPNERTTQEIYLTVRDEFKTLSNGLLKSSKKNSDGTRTDYWDMDMPHAPYLFMLAIGDFAIVEEKWEGMLLQYYVEPKYEKHAKAIFSNTPEMLTFFSDYVGVKYPWQKYSQVVVRDYVSGAMENTTGVIFGDFVQRTDRELIDNTNERIVAHELMHHWFGDLVTCESWANLTMNEGFANYSEYLWFEHEYGRDAADYHLFGEQAGYLNSATMMGAHPLIHFGYNDKEDMFDAHSYNKGGAVLHMLRKTVGDDAFRAGLKKYLTDNQFEAVEAHDLRLAMEDVTGMDLNWFFNQWYFEEGHPTVNIEYGYDASSSEAIVSIKQTQEGNYPGIFILPMAIDIYLTNNKAPIRKMVQMDQREQTFRFPVSAKPKLILADAEHYLLGSFEENNKSEEEYVFQFNNAPLFKDRYTALLGTKESSSNAVKTIREKALNDKFWAIRNLALDAVTLTDNPAVITKIADIAKNDPHSKVKASALLKLAEIGDKQHTNIVKSAISNEKSYTVIAAGLEALAVLDIDEAISYAPKLEKEESASILAAVGKLYAEKGEIAKMPFFEKHLSEFNGYPAINFIGSYANLSMKGGTDKILVAGKNLFNLSENMNESPWRRYGGTKALDDLYQFLKAQGDVDNAMKIKKYISDIKAKENNSQLQNMYKNFGK